MSDGGKNKKYGRNARRPAQLRYVSSKQLERNKARNIKRATLLERKVREKIVRRFNAGTLVLRGNARRERRYFIERKSV